MTCPAPTLVLDFDSTLVSVEGADELFARTLGGAPDAEERLARFAELTDQGMAGEISYDESLRARLALLTATQAEVAAVGLDIVSRITPSVLAVRDRLARHADRIWVISGGFEELIRPSVRALGLRSEHIRAHRFRWTPEGRVGGVDPGTAVARGGKPLALRECRLPRPIWVIGDGATDLELRELGVADRFYAFTENRLRSGIAERADGILTTLDQLPTLT